MVTAASAHADIRLLGNTFVHSWTIIPFPKDQPAPRYEKSRNFNRPGQVSEFERGEFDDGAPVTVGFGEEVAHRWDGACSRFIAQVVVPDQAPAGEWWPSAVTQEALQSCAVARADAHARVEREASRVIPGARRCPPRASLHARTGAAPGLGWWPQQSADWRQPLSNRRSAPPTLPRWSPLFMRSMTMRTIACQ